VSVAALARPAQQPTATWPGASHGKWECCVVT